MTDMTQEGIGRAHPSHSGGYFRKYALVMLGLAIITLAEVGVAELMPETPGNIFLLVVLSISKIVLVAQNYMHLQSDSKWFTYIFIIPIPFIFLITTILLLSGIILGRG